MKALTAIRERGPGGPMNRMLLQSCKAKSKALYSDSSHKGVRGLESHSPHLNIKLLMGLVVLSGSSIQHKISQSKRDKTRTPGKHHGITIKKTRLMFLLIGFL